MNYTKILNSKYYTAGALNKDDMAREIKALIVQLLDSSHYYFPMVIYDDWSGKLSLYRDSGDGANTWKNSFHTVYESKSGGFDERKDLLSAKEIISALIIKVSLEALKRKYEADNFSIIENIANGSYGVHDACEEFIADLEKYGPK